MGCLQTKQNNPTPDEIQDPPAKMVDPRLPFENYRQLFRLKNSWKSVTRVIEEAALDNLVMFFRQHPEHKALHKDLLKLETDDSMRESMSFQNTALDIFTTIDEVMSCMEKVDQAIIILNRVGQAHQHIDGFQPSFFKNMEEPFLQSVKIVLDDRYTETTEDSFRLLYQFICKHLVEGFQDDGNTDNPGLKLNTVRLET